MPVRHQSEEVKRMDDQAFRRTYIGGSDAAPIAGVGRWGSPYSVWLGKVQPSEPNEPSERMSWGLLLEEPVAKEWARREGVSFLRRGGFRRHPSIPYLGGHLDFTGQHPTDGRIVIETKLSDADWGEEVPLQYFLQVQHYLLVTGIEVGYLVVLIRGNELKSFRLPADADVHAGLLEAYEDFWRLVETQEPPDVDGHEATAEALKRRYPRDEVEEIIASPVDALLVDRLLEARRAVALAETEETEAANRVKARMATAGRLLSSDAVITWKQSKDRSVTDWASVAKAYRSILEGSDSFTASSPDGEHEGRVILGDLPDLDAIESIHTNTMPGARPFRVVAKREE